MSSGKGEGPSQDSLLPPASAQKGLNFLVYRKGPSRHWQALQEFDECKSDLELLLSDRKGSAKLAILFQALREINSDSEGVSFSEDGQEIILGKGTPQEERMPIRQFYALMLRKKMKAILLKIALLDGWEELAPNVVEVDLGRLLPK